jgi:TRAP-type C4-dicarboxylate transport system permease small subunit
VLRAKSVVAAIDDKVLHLEGMLVAGLVAAMTVIVFAQVIFRYVVGNPLVWSEELARYLFVWVTMIGAGAAVRLGQHYGLDILVKPLPPLIRSIVAFMASILITIVACSLVWQGLKEAAGAMHHAASSLEIPMVWFYAAIPLGGALMLWHVLARLVVLGLGSSPLAAHGPAVAPQAAETVV